MTWLDLSLLALIALCAALGAKRYLTGFVVGVGSLVLFRLLLGVFGGNRPLGLLFALLAGVLLGFLGRSLLPRRRGSALGAQALGALGGGLLGLLCALTLVTSLPIEYNARNEIVYPPQYLPESLRRAVSGSAFVDLGRDILLYPLLASAEPNASSGILGLAHAYFVLGEPWERS